MSLARAGANVSKSKGPVSFFGMDLKLDDGTSVPMSSHLGAAPDVRYADGDPGIEIVIRDLIETMMLFKSDEAVMGDVQAWVGSPNALLADWNRDLMRCTEGGQVVRSPLLALIEGSWLKFWCPRDE